MKFKSIVFFLFLQVIMVAPAFAVPALDIGPPATGTYTAGGTVTVPITLSNSNNALATVGMDIGYDPTQLTFVSATAGASAVAVGFGASVGADITSSTISKPANNIIRFGVLPVSQTAIIPDGTVANLTFTVSASASGTLTLTNTPSATDAQGNDILPPNITGTNETLTKALLTQTITFPAIPAKTYGAADFSPGATASSGLAVSYASSNTSVATIVSGNIHIIGVGTSTITASQGGDATYSTATNVQQTLTVNPAAQTITFGALAAKTYGAADFSPGATASSGLAVSYTSSNLAVATIVAGNIHIVGVGTSIITATQAGTANVNAATSVPQTLTVGKAALTITADNKSRLINTANPALTYTPSGFVNGETATVLSGAPALTTTAVQTSPVGTYPITIGAGTLAASNYTFTLVNGTLTVFNGPTLTVNTLPDGTSTKNSTLTVSGTVTAATGGSAVSSLTVTDNGGTPAVVTFDGSGNFSTAITLSTGANVIVVAATDAGSNTSTNTRTITLDPTLADLKITQPTDGSYTSKTFVDIVGTVGAPQSTTVTITLNGVLNGTATLNGDNFTYTVNNLVSGANTILITATDTVTGVHTVQRNITSDTNAPSLQITSPAQDVTIRNSSITLSGTVTETVTSAQISISANGQTYTPAVAADGSFSQLIPLPDFKTYPIIVTATDLALNVATVQRNVIRAYPTGALDGTSTPTVADAIKVLRFSLGLDTPTAAQLVNCDVGPLDGNKKPSPDGVIDIRDVLLVLERAVGTITW